MDNNYDLNQEIEKLQEELKKEKLLSKLQKETYDLAFQYIDKAIYTQHSTMNHQENTEYEKGQINGLIQASNIVNTALRVISSVNK